jgi:hypothetical protein
MNKKALKLASLNKILILNLDSYLWSSVKLSIEPSLLSNLVPSLRSSLRRSIDSNLSSSIHASLKEKRWRNNEQESSETQNP